MTRGPQPDRAPADGRGRPPGPPADPHRDRPGPAGQAEGRGAPRADPRRARRAAGPDQPGRIDLTRPGRTGEESGGPADLRAGDRVRGRLHLWRYAAADPRRGRPLPVPAGGHLGPSSNVFLRNGSRIYLDVGSHPEYATAECDDLIQLINHDRAGERILEDLIVDAEQRLASEGISGDIYLFKNNTDSHGNSYGCHENYLISRVGDFAKITDVLVPFLVSRQLICGAGKVLHTARGAEFSVSQRAEHIWESVSSATTRSRPIINTRDEPHADPERYRRLHVIVGDSNMSETTTLLKVGSAELVLRLIEAGVPMRDFTLENPIRAIRDMSRDRTGRTTVSRCPTAAASRRSNCRPSTTRRSREFVRREGARARRPSTGCWTCGSGPCGRSPRTSWPWSTPRSTG